MEDKRRKLHQKAEYQQWEKVKQAAASGGEEEKAASKGGVPVVGEGKTGSG